MTSVGNDNKNASASSSSLCSSYHDVFDDDDVSASVSASVLSPQYSATLAILAEKLKEIEDRILDVQGDHQY